MSHTSQRRGLDPSRPGQELLVLAMVSKPFRGKEGIDEAVMELAAKMHEHGRDHWPKWVNDRLKEASKRLLRSSLAVAFTDVKRVVNLLNDLKSDWLVRNKEKGLPVSIVLTGLLSDTHACCQKTGFKEHTYLHSLGFFGRVQDLPSEDELSLVTMCGHGLIAKNRVTSLVKSIREGELTPEEAAEDIARPCVCGIGNKERAQEIFERLAKQA